MSKFKELRDYITEAVSYRKIGSSLVGYFDSIYVIYLSIMKGVASDYTQKKVNQNKLRELKKIVLYHLVDVKNPLKVPQLQVALDRLEYKYESIETDKKPLTEISTKLKLAVKMARSAQKIGKAQKIIGPIIALGFTVAALAATMIKKRKEREVIAGAIQTDQMFKTTYDAYIYPAMERILNDITNRRIKKESQLKQSFYRIIDRLNEFNPMIAPYLKTWGTGV